FRLNRSSPSWVPRKSEPFGFSSFGLGISRRPLRPRKAADTAALAASACTTNPPARVEHDHGPASTTTRRAFRVLVLWLSHALPLRTRVLVSLRISITLRPSPAGSPDGAASLPVPA